jgi:hypothetical protein
VTVDEPERLIEGLKKKNWLNHALYVRFILNMILLSRLSLACCQLSTDKTHVPRMLQMPKLK